MRRFVRQALVTAALVAAPMFAATPAFAASDAAPKKTPAVADVPAYEAEVGRLINVERVKRGCSALRTDGRLAKAARAHSSDMVRSSYFSHTGADGSTFVTREVAAGYPRNGASAENIAWGYRTPQDVVTGWMNSPGHRANILDCSSIAAGVGLFYASSGAAYWTQDFGRI